MSKEVLVTGAAGFAGSHQVDKSLALGQSVVAQVRETLSLANLAEATLSPNLTIAKLDLRSHEDVQELLREYQPETIIHLAALSNVNNAIANPLETIDNNFLSTFNILDAVAKVSPHSFVVLTGSSHEFGIPKNDYPEGVDETVPLYPQNPYGVSKVEEDRLMGSFTKRYGIRIVKARVFNHSGPRRPDTFFDGKLAKEAAQLKHKGEKWIARIGNKEYSRDWQHVYNWNDANLILAQSGNNGETYNVASGQPHSHQQFVETLAQTLGIAFEIVEDSALLRPGDPLKTFANNQKLRKLGWSPSKSFEQMIEDSASYWYAKLQD